MPSVVLRRSALVVTAFVLAACGGAASATSSSPAASTSVVPASPAVSASPAASASASAAATSPSGTPAASPSSSASTSGASCVDRATYALLMATRDYKALTQEQVDAIVGALTAFDYGSDTTGANWRDRFVAALKAGDRAKAQEVATALVMGRGAGEPIACPS